MNNYIIEFLKNNGNIGAKNGIKATDLLSALGRNITEDSKRHFKNEIRNLRLTWKAGDDIENYILSDTMHGYYLAENIEEIKSFVELQSNRAISNFKTISAIRKYLKRVETLGEEVMTNGEN